MGALDSDDVATKAGHHPGAEQGHGYDGLASPCWRSAQLLDEAFKLLQVAALVDTVAVDAVLADD
jgi:hypothetical protein